MKKMIMMAALFFGTYTIASAQDQSKGNSRPTQEQRAQNQSGKMQQFLGLTPQQKTKVDEVNRDFMEKMKAARADKNVRIQDIHAERNSKLETILTKEQQAKWQEYNKERMRGRHEGQKAQMRDPQERQKSVKGMKKGAN